MSTWNESLFSADGFLLRHEDWTPQLAIEIAAKLEIELTANHWRIVHGVRAFYARTGRSLSMRPLVRVVRNDIDQELGSSLELAKLFGHKTTRHVAMLSGLPKPSDCI